MFVGIDHGTTAMRFASTDGGRLKISRTDARSFTLRGLAPLCGADRMEGIAVCYSMGDAISAITPIGQVPGRGIVSREGAGEHIGGGTRVYDEIKGSGLPAVVIPGLHRGSPTDRRFAAYSHQASPEKIGIAYRVARDLGADFVVSDVSSNTVTVLVVKGRIVGAFDACIFAPGMRHGAIDVDAIRKIDRRETTANEAFQKAGVMFTMPEADRLRTVAMFAAMECAAMLILKPDARVAIAGTLAPSIGPEVEMLLKRSVAVYDEWCAADGLAAIAQDVFSGSRNILGIPVKPFDP